MPGPKRSAQGGGACREKWAPNYSDVERSPSSHDRLHERDELFSVLRGRNKADLSQERYRYRRVDESSLALRWNDEESSSPALDDSRGVYSFPYRDRLWRDLASDLMFELWGPRKSRTRGRRRSPMLEREGSSRRGRAGNGLRSEGGCVALGLEIAFRPRRRLVAQEIERELVPRRKVVVRGCPLTTDTEVLTGEFPDQRAILLRILGAPARVKVSSVSYCCCCLKSSLLIWSACCSTSSASYLLPWPTSASSSYASVREPPGALYRGYNRRCLEEQGAELVVLWRSGRWLVHGAEVGAAMAATSHMWIEAGFWGSGGGRTGHDRWERGGLAVNAGGKGGGLICWSSSSHARAWRTREKKRKAASLSHILETPMFFGHLNSPSSTSPAACSSAIRRAQRLPGCQSVRASGRREHERILVRQAERCFISSVRRLASPSSRWGWAAGLTWYWGQEEMEAVDGIPVEFAAPALCINALLPLQGVHNLGISPLETINFAPSHPGKSQRLSRRRISMPPLPLSIPVLEAERDTNADSEREREDVPKPPRLLVAPRRLWTPSSSKEDKAGVSLGRERTSEERVDVVAGSSDLVADFHKLLGAKLKVLAQRMWQIALEARIKARYSVTTVQINPPLIYGIIRSISLLSKAIGPAERQGGTRTVFRRDATTTTVRKRWHAVMFLGSPVPLQSVTQNGEYIGSTRASFIDRAECDTTARFWSRDGSRGNWLARDSVFERGGLPARMKEILEYDNDRPVVLECLVEEDERAFRWCLRGRHLHGQLVHPIFPINGTPLIVKSAKLWVRVSLFRLGERLWSMRHSWRDAWTTDSRGRRGYGSIIPPLHMAAGCGRRFDLNDDVLRVHSRQDLLEQACTLRHSSSLAKPIVDAISLKLRLKAERLKDAIGIRVELITVEARGFDIGRSDFQIRFLPHFISRRRPPAAHALPAQMSAPDRHGPLRKRDRFKGWFKNLVTRSTTPSPSRSPAPSQIDVSRDQTPRPSLGTALRPGEGGNQPSSGDGNAIEDSTMSQDVHAASANPAPIPPEPDNSIDRQAREKAREVDSSPAYEPPGTGRKFYEGVKTTLRAIERATDVFTPLKSTAAALLVICEAIDAYGENREEFKRTAEEGRSNFLHHGILAEGRFARS
ncbi:hypothetical protein DFP72DRAFT_1040223 [Ephemerocybe angulata]|uniref:Uncharacterized protein n=1 Tax=Ephemerocybe angulata TaxID=980116 RepID=A0A8H6IF67_9AGAR|nr:hypothetical protein DFP72DRAFT_1040223 [Tulosesus angulatus]